MSIGKEVGTVFETVDFKFERAEYFLEKIGTVPIGTQPWRAYLEAFFFELISAKDFFLQAINGKYGLGLERDEATKIDLLKRCLACRKYNHVLETVKSIERKLSDPNSWLWKLNNYRNSSTHRELLRIGYDADPNLNVTAHLFEDPEDSKKGNMELEVKPYCRQSLKTMRDFLEELYSKLS